MAQLLEREVEPLLGLLALGDVHAHAGHAQGLALRVEDHAALALDPALPPEPASRYSM